MRVLVVMQQAFVIREILCHFGLPDTPPEVPRSCAPPELDFALTKGGATTKAPQGRQGTAAPSGAVSSWLEPLRATCPSERKVPGFV
jgi:hypothetical protein